MISVDGYFAGPNEELDWHVVDDDFNTYALEMLASVDTLIFGRVTYDMMASYWQSKAGVEDSLEVAQAMNALRKIVFSRDMQKANWNNTKVVNEIDAAAITAMKNEPGKDMVILGSGTIVQQLTDLGLIDEYRLIVAPVALGVGKALFGGIQKRLKLTLTGTKVLACGDVIMYYKPITQ